MFTSVTTMIAIPPTVTGARSPSRPSSAATVAPKPAARAAMDPGKAIQKLVHPLRNPMAGP